MRPRVGLLTTSYPSAPGDPAGGFVAEHAAWLRSRGASVEVVAARPGRAAERPGLRVVRVPGAAGLLGGEGAPERLSGSRRWAEAIAVSAGIFGTAARRRRDWDRIVAHWLVPAGVAAVAVAGGRPVRAIAHSGDVHLLRKLGLATPVAAALVGGGARISFVSEALRELFLREVRPSALRRAALRASEVTPMGVEVGRLRAAATRERPRHVGFLGRLVPVKGADVAVEAAGLWRAKAPLAVAGAGPDEAALRGRAELLSRDRGAARVEFLGRLRGEARDRFLGASRALVVPSRTLPDGRTEGMPVAALEAMAAGVPVIGSAVGGLAELPRDAVALVPPGDSTALAGEVDRLLGDDGARERQVAAASAFVRGRDWSAVGPRLW